MKQSTFADRLGYSRWLRHLMTGEAPGNADIARAVERTGPWVTKWAASDTPPRDFEVHAPMAAFLGVDERWLFRAEGEAPEPDLWRAWAHHATARAAHVTVPSADERPSYLRVAERVGGELATGSAELPGNKKAPAKRIASVPFPCSTNVATKSYKCNGRLIVDSVAICGYTVAHAKETDRKGVKG